METHEVSVIGYHPTNLCYNLEKNSDFSTPHPTDPSGDPTLAVGVHNIISTGPWETNMVGSSSGTLQYHDVPLSSWTATRAEFANATAETKTQALKIGPAFNNGRWGTHLGATLSVVTADGYTVFRSREGKYAEDHLYDSLVAGTMLSSDASSSTLNTLDYFRTLLYKANVSLSRDVIELHPTHLAVRPLDFGLWIGGWFSVGLTADKLAQIVPFKTVKSDLKNTPGFQLTPCAEFDLQAMKTHLDGNVLVSSTLLP